MREPVAIELSVLERRVLQGMADGKSNAEIGAGMHVSENTVKTHVRRLFMKLGARDRANAVRLAFDAGLLRSPSVASKVRAVLDAEKETRRDAPALSRYTRLYDAVQAALRSRSERT